MPKSSCERQPQMQPCRSWGRYWHPCSTCYSAYQTIIPHSLSTPLLAPSLGAPLKAADREQPPTSAPCMPCLPVCCLGGLGEPSKAPAVVDRAGKQIF